MRSLSGKALESLEALWPDWEALLRTLIPQENRTWLIGIGGPGGVGKSGVAAWLKGKIPGARVLPLDDYRLPRAQREPHGLLGSHPQGNDLTRLRRDLALARSGKAFERPIFDSSEGRATRSEKVPPTGHLICDGEIAAHHHLRKEFDLLILVESHWRTQLNSRLSRDLNHRSYELEKAIEVFLKSNLRDYPTFSMGAREEANLILYRTARGEFTRKKPLPPRTDLQD